MFLIGHKSRSGYALSPIVCAFPTFTFILKLPILYAILFILIVLQLLNNEVSCNWLLRIHWLSFYGKTIEHSRCASAWH